MNKKVVLILSVIGLIAFGGIGYYFENHSPSIDDKEIESLLKNPKKIPKIEWETLYKLDPDKSDIPAEVKPFNGKLVRIAGFIVPLTDEYMVLDEFLLVPDAQSCIHVPPPPPNLIIHVKLRKPLPIEKVFNPSWLTGILHVEETKSQYGNASYRMDGIKLEKYQYFTDQ